MNTQTGSGWQITNGDCVEWLSKLPAESVDFSVFSPPFNSLFAYSDDPRDLSNSDNTAQFFEHFGFVLRELYRVMKPGRLVSQHVMTLPVSKARDGHIGLYDFGGDVIRAAEKAGFWFHSKVTIWKCPVVAMTRTKAMGLLYKQLIKDSAMSRQGIPDEVLTFRKPGDNEEPVTHKKPATEMWPDVEIQPEQTIDKGGDVFPVSLWQKWASPVWTDIDQGDVLPSRAAKEADDQKHLCPLQLDVIRRCIRLWSNRGDVVLSPFAGIGSELYVALQEGRNAIGAELKASYWRQAVANLQAAERRTGDLFANLQPTAHAIEQGQAEPQPEDDREEGYSLPGELPEHDKPELRDIFAEMYPMARTAPELWSEMTGWSLTAEQVTVMMGKPLPEPGTAAFDEIAHWSRVSKARSASEAARQRNEPGIDGLYIPTARMPPALAKMLRMKPARKKREPKNPVPAPTSDQTASH